jgi:hypothetical protein
MGDVVGFEEPGELQTYGLRLITDGHYVRAPITQEDWDVELKLRFPYILLKPGRLLSHLTNVGGKVLVSYSPSGKGVRELVNTVNGDPR